LSFKTGRGPELIETKGTSWLELLPTGEYVIDPRNNTKLRYENQNFIKGSLGDWQPTGSEKTADNGYLVSWKNTSTDQFIIWQVDSDGNYISSETANLNINGDLISDYELLFSQDFNDDAKVGHDDWVFITNSEYESSGLHIDSNNIQNSFSQQLLRSYRYSLDELNRPVLVERSNQSINQPAGTYYDYALIYYGENSISWANFTSTDSSPLDNNGYSHLNMLQTISLIDDNTIIQESINLNNVGDNTWFGNSWVNKSSSSTPAADGSFVAEWTSRYFNQDDSLGFGLTDWSSESNYKLLSSRKTPEGAYESNYQSLDTYSDGDVESYFYTTSKLGNRITISSDDADEDESHMSTSSYVKPVQDRSLQNIILNDALSQAQTSVPSYYLDWDFTRSYEYIKEQESYSSHYVDDSYNYESSYDAEIDALTGQATTISTMTDTQNYSGETLYKGSTSDDLTTEQRITDDSLIKGLESILLGSLSKFDALQSQNSGYFGSGEDLIGQNRRYLFETTDLGDKFI